MENINKYFEKRLVAQREWYDKKASLNKSKYVNFQKTIIILGATIPVVVAICAIFDKTELAAVISAIISAIISILAGIDKLVQHQTNWYNFRAAEEILKKEEWLFEYRVGPYSDLTDKKAAKVLIERVENIISADMARFSQSSENNKEYDDFIQNELKNAIEKADKIKEEALNIINEKEISNETSATTKTEAENNSETKVSTDIADNSTKEKIV